MGGFALLAELDTTPLLTEELRGLAAEIATLMAEGTTARLEQQPGSADVDEFLTACRRLLLRVAQLDDAVHAVSTDSRLTAALADAHLAEIIIDMERYQLRTLAAGHAAVRAADEAAAGADSAEDVPALLAAANYRIAEQAREPTDAVLGSVLFTVSNRTTNRVSRPDG